MKTKARSTNWILSACVLLLFLQPLACWAQGAQQEAARFFRDELKHTIDLFADDFRSALSASERSVFDRIEFRYPLDVTSIESPHAFLDGQRPVVVIGTGYYRSLHAIADLQVIQMKMGGEERTGDYMAYAIPRLVQNGLRSARRQEFIRWPFDYYGVPQETAIRWIQNGGGSEMKAGILLGAVAFIYAHEVAHHVLGHTHSAPETLAESREWEADADQWACRTLIKAGYLPVGAVYALTIAYFLDQEAIEHEHVRKHPAELRRFDAAIETTIESLDRFGERITLQGQSVEVLKANLKRASNEIKADIRRYSKSRE